MAIDLSPFYPIVLSPHCNSPRENMQPTSRVERVRIRISYLFGGGIKEWSPRPPSKKWNGIIFEAAIKRLGRLKHFHPNFM
jgi:hypothetical protein